MIVAPLLRLGIVAITWISGTPKWFFGQASELAVLAESLQTGHGLSSPFGGMTGPTAFLTPGYPAIVAAVFAVFHPYSMASAVAITVLQAVFGGATAIVLMLVARRLFGIKVAVLAGIGWSLFPTLLFVPTFFWETSLSTLFVMGLIGLAFRCRETNGRAWWLAMGLVAAAALCVNPSLLTVIVCCFGRVVWQNRRQSMSAAMVGVGVFLVLSAIWPIRNLRVMHAWIPLRSNMGYELWQGNRPGADGFFHVEFHPNTNPAELRRWQQVGELGYMKEKTDLAKAAIVASPGRFLRLTGRRFLYFWTGWHPATPAIVGMEVTLTSLLGLWGAGLMIWRRREDAALLILPLLLFPLPYYITHPDFRFRLVLEPILLMLSGYAATEFRWGSPLGYLNRAKSSNKST